ncbi:hypothetical protein TRFO_11467 [Tritrichomonas foetus]|uniref:Chromo domain-containing protein n=1 Tax=Tritrichomonas foetus TaxID=1144522 RepID=A0A1J4J3I3_9EUKA|nr:hypothetical protein TRFO_11467 [Tritrichomonas foetus]|eukprot:OHS93982.1 hypothetical protein TRFO_11467 [Tritrichomonas foetus]
MQNTEVDDLNGERLDEDVKVVSGYIMSVNDEIIYQGIHKFYCLWYPEEGSKQITATWEPAENIEECDVYHDWIKLRKETKFKPKTIHNYEELVIYESTLPQLGEIELSSEEFEISDDFKETQTKSEIIKTPGKRGRKKGSNSNPKKTQQTLNYFVENQVDDDDDDGDDDDEDDDNYEISTKRTKQKGKLEKKRKRKNDDDSDFFDNETITNKTVKTRGRGRVKKNPDEKPQTSTRRNSNKDISKSSYKNSDEHQQPSSLQQDKSVSAHSKNTHTKASNYSSTAKNHHNSPSKTSKHSNPSNIDSSNFTDNSQTMDHKSSSTNSNSTSNTKSKNVLLNLNDVPVDVNDGVFDIILSSKFHNPNAQSRVILINKMNTISDFSRRTLYPITALDKKERITEIVNEKSEDGENELFVEITNIDGVKSKIPYFLAEATFPEALTNYTETTFLATIDNGWHFEYNSDDEKDK